MTSETDTEVVKPFGDRLAEARRSLGLTLEELSETLNLDIKLLEALERSDIEQLPPAIYVQGYIKAYTKALAISSDDIHADYLKSVGGEQDIELQPRSPLPIETTSETPIVKTISILFAVLAISALLFMIYSYYSDKVDTVDYSIVEKKIDSDFLIELPVEKTIAEPEMEIIGDEAYIVEKNLIENPLESADDSDSEIQASIDASTDEAVSNQLAPDEVAVKAAVDETVVIEDQDSLMVRATTESWAEIRDDNKVRIYYGMLKAEDLRILKGKAPFDVFLGNALNVNIAVNDIDVDMSDYIRANNVAHFKVSEKSNQIVFH